VFNTDVTIVLGAMGTTTGGTFSAGGVFTPTAANAAIANGDIQGFLNAGTSVTINTTSAFGSAGAITEGAGATITKSAGGNAALSLTADTSIALNNAISSSTGQLAVSTSGTTFDNTGGAITTNGGAVTINHTGSVTIGANLTSGNGTISVTGAGVTESAGVTVDAGNSTITINGGGGALNFNTGTLTTTSATGADITIANATTVALGNVTDTTVGGTLVIGNADITGNVTQNTTTTLDVNALLANTGTGSNVTLGNQNAVSNLAASTMGTITLTDSVALVVGTVNGTVGITTTADTSLVSDMANTLLTVNQPVMAGGNVTFQFDNMTLNAAVSATGQRVTLEPFSSGQLINLGGANAVGTLGLTNAELNEVTAATFQVGNSTGGNITVSNPITLTTVTTLSLITGGTISQNAGATITVTNLAAQGAGGVNLGEANQVNKLAGTTANHAFTFVDAGPVVAGVVTLTIAGPTTAVDGLTSINAGMSGDVNLTVGTATATGILVSATPNDNIADVVGRTVTLTALGPSNGNTGQIGFVSGGAQFFEVAATTLNASTNNSRLWISAIGGVAVGSINAGTNTAFLRTFNGDLTSTHSGATPDITAAAVNLSLAPTGASGSFGTSMNPLLVQTSTLSATVAAGTGSINVTNVAAGGDLSVASAMTTSGAINLSVAGGNLNVTGTTGTIINAPGNTVTLAASAAIVSSTGAGVTDVGGNGLVITSATAVGTSSNFLKTAVMSLGAMVGSGGLWITNTGSLTITGITATGGGSININNTGSITITGTVSAAAGGAVNLTASAAISESGAGLASTNGILTTVSSGGTLLNCANLVGSFHATNTISGDVGLSNTFSPLTVTGIGVTGGGSVNVNNGGALTISGAVSTAANGNISLTANNGVLTVGTAVTAGGSGMVMLTSTGTGNAIVVQGQVTSTSGDITANASGAITQSGGGLFATSGLLTTTSSRGQTLVGVNGVGSFHATNTASGNVLLNNTFATLMITGITNLVGSISVGNVGALTTSGAVMSGADSFGNGVSLTASGGTMTIGAMIAAGGSGSIALSATGTSSDVLVNAAVNNASGGISALAGHAITESGAGAFGTSGLLDTTSSAGQTLNGTNTAATLNASNGFSGNIAFMNTATLLSIMRISERGTGTIAVNNTGDVTVAGTVSADMGSISITLTGSLIVNAAITTPGAVTLQRTGQANGAITINAVITGSPINILGNAGNDIITVNVTGPNDSTHSLNLDGQGGSDTYVINLVSQFGNVLSLININDTGNTATDFDVAHINAGNSNSAFTVTATAVTTQVGGATQMVTYAGLESLTLNTGNGTDTVTVESTAAAAPPTAPLGTPVTVNGGTGNDAFVISSTPDAMGVLTGIMAPVTINAGAGVNTLSVSESASTAADAVVLTANAIGSSRGTFAQIRYAATGTFSNVLLRTGAGDDVVNVQGTAANVASTRVDSGAGNDLLIVSSTSDAAGVLTGIRGPLAIDGGAGANVLIVSEAGSTVADGVVLTTNAIGSSQGTFAPITYAASGGTFSNVVLRTGGGNDVINVQGTAGNVALTSVDSGSGNDTLIVSSTSDAAGVLTGIRGPLAIDAGPGANVLIVSEAGSAVADGVVLTANAIGSSQGTFAQITYAASGGTFSNVVLRTGGGADVVNVQGTAANVALTSVDSGGGNDTLIVSSTSDAAGVLTGIRGPLAIDGGAGANVLIVSEAGSTVADGVVLTTNAIGSSQRTFAQITYAASGGTFSNVVLRTGGGNDVINVQGTAANVALTSVDSGSGNDTLIVSSTSDAAGVLTGIRGPLAIDAGPGANVLIVSEAGSAVADGVVLTANAISSSRGTFAQINYAASGGTFSNVVLDTGAGDDFINVQSTSANVSLTTVGTFGGNDTITVSSAAAADNSGVGLLSGIRGPLAVDAGTGSNFLWVSESGSAAPDNIVLTANTIVSTLATFAPISYGASGGTFSNVVLRATGGGHDFVNVQGTAANVSLTTVGTFGGNNTITVSSAAASDGSGIGLLSAIRGPLAVDAGTGSNFLWVSELASAAADNLVMTAGSIVSTLGTFAPISYRASGGTFSNVVLRATGGGHDFVNVQSTAANVSLTTAGTFGGNNTIVVSSATNAQGNGVGALSQVRGPLSVDGGAGSNTLVVSDSAGTAADAVTVTANSITSTLATPVFAPIFYQSTGGHFALNNPALAQTTSVGTSIQAGIALLLAQRSNTVHVTGQLAGSSTYISLGQVPAANLGTVDVTSTSAYQGLTVDLGTGFNSLTVNDVSGGAQASIVPGAFFNSGQVLVSYAGGSPSQINFFGSQVTRVFSGGHQIA
jgi:hypothetical protein